MPGISKKQQRSAAQKARAFLPSKDERSELILKSVAELPNYQSSKRVAFYIHVRNEVRTRSLLERELAGRRREVVVPYCVGDTLRLAQIRSLDDLEIGEFGIPEPRADLRSDLRFAADINSVEAILVPGVAFDRCGNRIGYGAGYYDRLLATANGVTKIGLAFDCQIVDEIASESFDVSVDFVCTEYSCFHCREH